MTHNLSCSSDSSGDIGKCSVHLLQPPACDWGIPGAGPQCECLGFGARGGSRSLQVGVGVESPPGLLLEA